MALILRKDDIFEASTKVLAAGRGLLSNIQAGDKNKVAAFKFQIKDILNEGAKLSAKKSNITELDLLNYISALEKLAVDIDAFEKSEWQTYISQSDASIDQYKNHNYLILVIYSLIYIVFLYINLLRGRNEKLFFEKKRTDDFYFQLFESLNEGIVLCNENGAIKACNKSFSAYIDMSQSKISSQSIERLFKNYYFIDIENTLKGKMTFKSLLAYKVPMNSLAMSFHGENNEQKWLSINTQPVANEDDIQSTILSFTDITDKVNTERVIREQQEKILETSRHQAIGEIASGIAHEINNPLAIILMAIEKLELKADLYDKMDSIEVQKVTGKVIKTVDRISKVVKGFLNYSRGEIQQKERISVRLILNIALDLYQMKLHEDDIDLIINDRNMSTELICSPTQIAQVIINLIKNSTHAIKNLDDRWIRLEAFEREGFVYISIQDSGRGMSKQTSEEILKPFFTTKGFGNGTGLGLSISQTIVEEHGGEISIEREPHTKFTVRLPCSIVDSKDTKEVA
jgi:signal transduction histidine kinase